MKEEIQRLSPTTVSGWSRCRCGGAARARASALLCGGFTSLVRSGVL